MHLIVHRYLFARAATLFSLLLLAYSCTDRPVSYPLVHVPVVINEFMTKNTTDSIVDELKQSDDWIELYNTSDTPFDLSLLYLSDDSTRLNLFELPDQFISGHGHYLLWADDNTAEGKNHVPFKLSSSDGDELILSTRWGRIVDRIQFYGEKDALLENVSYGRTSDGAPTWSKQRRPTPGKSNISD